jgi:hypothetical protein
MCKSCAKPHPTQDECHALFYRNNGVLHRQALPRSRFNQQSTCTTYNKRANAPVTIYGQQRNIQVLGYNQLPLGLILLVMDGGTPADWYHREIKTRNRYGEFTKKYDDGIYDEAEGYDVKIPPKFPQYALIPARIYRNGFLELRKCN